MNRASTGLRLTILGDLRLDSPAGELLHRRRKELALLAWLGCRTAPARRDEVAAAFWGDRDDAHARQSLRQALAGIRRALPEALRTGEELVSVWPGAVEIDAVEFERELAAGRLGAALELWKGDLLPFCEDVGAEPFRSWLDTERARLRARLAGALERLTTGAPDVASEVRWAERWTELFPFDERAHAHLLAAFAGAGRAEEALERHADFAARLLSETGHGPSASLAGTADALRLRRSGRHQPGSAALFTPDLVGREGEFAALDAAWAAARESRGVAVLIEGEPGSGRTRLCAELVRRVRDAGRALVLEVPEVSDGGSSSQRRRFLDPLASAPGLAAAPPWALGDLATLLPQLAAGRALPAPRHAADSAAAALDVIRSVADEVPVLVLVDDVTRLDGELRPIIAALIRRPPPSLLIVITATPGTFDRGEYARSLRECPDSRRIKLRPLDSAQIDAMIGSMLPIAASDRQRLTALLLAETGGNPLQVSDCISAFADAGVLSLDRNGFWRFPEGREPASLPLPASLIRTRLDQLSAVARATIEAAGRGGHRVEAEDLVGVTGLPTEEVEEALGELVSRRFLRPLRNTAAFEFSSQAVRRVVADSARARDDRRRPSGRTGSGRRRVVGIGLAAIALVVLALATLAEGPELPASSPGAPARMIVFPLANATGDAALEPIGRRAAERLTRGMTGLEMIPVAPVPLTSGRGDGESGVARRAGATLAIRGAFRRSGDSLVFDAQLVDLAEGKVSAVLETVGAPADRPEQALASLEDRTLGLLAARLDPRTAEVARLGSIPRSYTAYRAMAEGLDRFYAREPADAPLRRAHAADSTFTLPLVYLALQYIGEWRWAALDSVTERLGSRTTLPPFEQTVLAFLRAFRSGDLAARYATARRAAELAPGSIMATVHYPAAAIALNRPREAVQLLDRVDPMRETFGLPGYWSLQSMALHGAAEYRRQLEIGNYVARRLPNDRRGPFYQVRALAALGRLDSLDAVLAEGLMMQPRPGRDAVGLALHLVAFDELRAHGHAVHATRVLARAVAFYEAAPDSLRLVPRQRLVLGTALLRLGRVGEARRLLAELARSTSLSRYNSVVLEGTIGIAAAMDGDTIAAAAADRELAATPYPMFAVSTDYRARIAAVQGRRADAVRLLRQAVAEGAPHDNTKHSDFELSHLRGYPPFEEWLRPKG